MTRELALLFLLPALSAHADLAAVSAEMPCRKQVTAYLRPLAEESWVGVPISIAREPLHFGVAFRDTVKRKAYYLWHNGDATHVRLLPIGEGVAQELTWDPRSSCQKKAKALVPEAGPEVPAVGYSDADLFKDMKENTWGAIYVWTPQMHLSAEGVAAVKTAMKELKGHLTVLLDPYTRPDLAQDSVERGLVTERDLRQVASVELMSRSLRNHFPVLFIYENGFLSNRVYKGYKTVTEYKAWLSLEREALQKRRK